jgi:hypothetical protein
MTDKEIGDKLVELVSSCQGLKSVELVVRLLSDETFKYVGDRNIVEILDSLVLEKRLIEICYVLPSMPYRIKSFYLPGDSIITNFD